MISKNDWLWDRKISVKKAKVILKNPQNEHFLPLASILLSRKNIPREVFKNYLKPLCFVQNWNRIKKHMRLNTWNDPRIEFWQAIFERLQEKYNNKGINITRENNISRPKKDDFCKLVAGKIEFMRKQKGLTQKQLAKRLNISQQIISRIETGSENIALLTLKKIVDTLGAEIYLEILEKKK